MNLILDAKNEKKKEVGKGERGREREREIETGFVNMFGRGFTK
jgi:hypothetical protein